MGKKKGVFKTVGGWIGALIVFGLLICAVVGAYYLAHENSWREEYYASGYEAGYEDGYEAGFNEGSTAPQNYPKIK